MTKTKKLIIASIISIATLGGLVSYAKSGDHCHQGMHGKKSHFMKFMVERAASKMDLNEEQTKKLIAIKDLMMEQRQLHQDKNPRQQIIQLLSEPTLNQELALEMIKERTAHVESSAPKIIAAIADLTNTLNTEQRSKMQAMIEKMGQRKRGFRGGKKPSAEQSTNGQ